MSDKILCIIPSRFASSRLPGKPLKKIGNKTMISHVYYQVKKVFENVIVATDSPEIEQEILNFGGTAIMTSESHKSGTDRCAEALFIFEKKSGKVFENIINVQGDEPFINSVQLEEIKQLIEKNDTQIASLAKKIDDFNEIFDINTPKVVINKNKDALYFSRSPIPYVRDEEKEKWAKKYQFYKHIGMYAYKKNVLNEITKLESAELENSEKLEQNRWLFNGYNIKIGITETESLSVDTPEDLKKAIEIYEKLL